MQQGAGKAKMELKMRGNAPVPDFKLHTGAFALFVMQNPKTTVVLIFQEVSNGERGGTGIQ